MKYKVILWGHVKKGEEEQGLELADLTGKAFRRVCGETVEYAVTEDVDELEMLFSTRKQVILCMEEQHEPTSISWKANCRKMLYIPEMATLQVDQLLQVALLSVASPDHIMITQGLGGYSTEEQTGNAIGEMSLDILKHFQTAQTAKNIKLLLGLPQEAGLDQLCLIEDALKPYLPEDTQLYIDQIINQEPTATSCYVLHIEK